MRTTTILGPDGNPITRPGKASPELLPEHMRRLPSDYVTKEVGDDSRVHALDDEHAVEQIIEERDKGEHGIETAAQRADREKAERQAPKASEDPREHTLTQRRIDAIRLRVFKVLVGNQVNRAAKGLDLDMPVKHLHFPRDDDREYSLRDGNPPGGSDCPKHMRGLDVVLDIASGKLPASIKDWVREAESNKIMAAAFGVVS